MKLLNKPLLVVTILFALVETQLQSMERQLSQTDDQILVDEDAPIQALIALFTRYNLPLEIICLIARLIDDRPFLDGNNMVVTKLFTGSPWGGVLPTTIEMAIHIGSIAQIQWFLLMGGNPLIRIQRSPYREGPTLLELAREWAHRMDDAGRRRLIIARLLRRALQFMQDPNRNTNELFIKALGFFKQS